MTDPVKAVKTSSVAEPAAIESGGRILAGLLVGVLFALGHFAVR